MDKRQPRKRPTEQTANPTVSKYARFSEGDGEGAISWQEIDARLLHMAIYAATEDGCAIILSKTSDGGALSITLLEGTNRHKKYAKSAEIGNSMMHEIIALHND